MFKYLLSFSLMTTSLVMAQSEPQINIEEFRQVQQEAVASIQNFQLEETDLGVGAPDYIHARNVLLKILQDKPQKLDARLASLNDQLLDDYDLLVNLRNLDRSAATKRTVETAKERFKEKVRSLMPSYHSGIRDFIFNDLEKTFGNCITVLCLNRIKVDVDNWLKHAAKINRDIDFKEAKMGKMNKSLIKREAKLVMLNIDSREAGLVIALTRNDQSYLNLKDPSVTVEDVIEFGTNNIARVGKDGLTEDMRVSYRRYLCSGNVDDKKSVDYYRSDYFRVRGYGFAAYDVRPNTEDCKRYILELHMLSYPYERGDDPVRSF